MEECVPQVYLVAKTEMCGGGMARYLSDIGADEWDTDSPSSGERLVEAAGRMCYRSWLPWDPERPLASNPNVSKVREGNDVYLGHILEVGHGSILEHVNMTFICRDVSRVFTHELVRHRAGWAYSQESLRFVRLKDLRVWLPDEAKEQEGYWTDVIETLESVQAELTEMYKIEGMKDFNKKKQLTSMFRRLAPIGLATTIMFTANIRALRHVITMRTNPFAEIEIRLVFDMIAEVCKQEYPNFFQDMERGEEEYEWVLTNPKV